MLWYHVLSHPYDRQKEQKHQQHFYYYHYETTNKDFSRSSSAQVGTINVSSFPVLSVWPAEAK